jgi:hypothetical protein
MPEPGFYAEITYRLYLTDYLIVIIDTGDNFMFVYSNAGFPYIHKNSLYAKLEGIKAR